MSTASVRVTVSPRRAVLACGVAGVPMLVGIAVDVVAWIDGRLTSNAAADLALAPVAVLMAFLGVAITRKQPGHLVGLVFVAAFFLAGWMVLADAWAGWVFASPAEDAPLGSAALWLSAWLWVPVALGILVYLPLVFPDGTPPSGGFRWATWVVGAEVSILSVGAAFVPGHIEGYAVDNPLGTETPGNVFEWLSGVGFALILPCIALGVTTVVRRYRRSSGPERQQIKWLALGGLVAVSSVALSFAVVGLVPWIFSVSIPLAFATVVLAVGLAVLRYRLYDVDRIISRAIVYGSLTGLLGACYVALVLAGQALSSRFGGTSSLTVAVSTLVVAALFLPLRSRVQQSVDRRFYRRRYDAQRTLEAFGARLRDEVDLQALTGELGRVVTEAMQPAHMTIWRREAG